MKVFRHFTAGISGNLDITGIRSRVIEKYPEVGIEEIRLPGDVEGIRLSGISRGSIIVDSELNLSVDACVFPSGIIIFELSLVSESMPERVTAREFLKEKYHITANGRDSENALYMHCWLFFFELLQFSEILPRIADVNVVEDSNQMEIHDSIRDVSLIDVGFLGNQIYFETIADFGEDAVIIATAPEESELVYDGEEPAWCKLNVWYTESESGGFLNIYRFLIYRKNLLGVYQKNMTKWLELIGEESGKIRDRLEETNKVYWSKLKNHLEIWDLNFLAFLTKVSGQLSIFHSILLPHLGDSFRLKCGRDYSDMREMLLSSRDDIKYGLSNLKTPCEAHDEYLLQRETEKGNERIMLLSFLAMSIPLLGAILAPGISIGTKLISATLLLTAPFLYQHFRKVHLKRENSRAQLGYLINRRDAMEMEIKKAGDSIRTLRENPKLDESTKEKTVEFIEKSIATSRTHLQQIENEIEKFS